MTSVDEAHKFVTKNHAFTSVLKGKNTCRDDMTACIDTCCTKTINLKFKVQVQDSTCLCIDPQRLKSFIL